MFDNISPQVIVALVSVVLTAGVAVVSIFLRSLYQRQLEKEKFERNQKFEKEKFRMNQNSEQAIFLRGKLEDLNLLFLKWHDIGLVQASIYGQLITGEIDQSEAKMRTEALISQKHSDISVDDCLRRIVVIINLYFPSLVVSYNDVLDAFKKIPSDFSENSMPMISAEKHSENWINFQNTAKNFISKLAVYSESLAISD